MSLFVRLLIALALVLIIEIYVSLRVTKAIRIRIPKKPGYALWVFRAGLIYVNIFPVLYLINKGVAAVIGTPDPIGIKSDFIEYFLYQPFLAGLLVFVQSFLYLLPLDIIYFILNRWEYCRQHCKPYFAGLNIIVFFFFALYVPVTIYYDYATVGIRMTTLEVNNLAPDLDGLRITLIADLQADRYTQGERLSHYIKVVNETRPDLILIAGDFITGPPEYIPEIGRQVSKLKAPLGVYGCVGDHDQWAYRGDPVRSLNEVRAAVSGAGVPIIDDKDLTIKKGNAEINITFATNTYTRRLALQEAGALMDKTPNGGLKIFLVHQPDEEMMKMAAAKGYDLYLAGHTHGGQITLMFPFVQLTPTLLETKYIKGDFYFGNMLAIVTRGLGMSILPVRYNSQPEVTVIDVKKK